MPCDLAVTITKAAVTQEHLLGLLDAHAAELEQVLLAVVRQQDPRATSACRGTTLSYRCLGALITIRRGEVTVSAALRSNAGALSTLASQLADLLARAGDLFFQQEIAAILQQVAPVSAETVTVRSGARQQEAARLTLRL